MPATRLVAGRVIEPLTAGTTIDILARLYAEKLSNQFGQQVVVSQIVPARPVLSPVGGRHLARRWWIAALERDLDLIVNLDDATGAIYSAFLVEQEGTMSSLLGLAETIAEHGLFGAFYTDRGGHYFVTPKDGGKVDKTQPTQVGRALATRSSRPKCSIAT